MNRVVYQVVWYGRRAILLALLAGILVSCAGQDRRILLYDNGLKKSVTLLKNEIAEGAFTTWHRNGELASTGYNHNGSRHGLFLEFDETGTPVVKRLYDAGTIVWQGEPSAPLPSEIAAQLLATILTNAQRRPSIAHSSLAPDASEGAINVRAGLHNGERNGFSLDVNMSYPIGRFIPLASLNGSGVFDTNKGPSGSKLTGALGGAFRVTDRAGYRLAVVGKLAFPIAGDDLGGFTAVGNTSTHMLSELYRGEPNSSAVALSLVGRRAWRSRLLRIEAGLAPTWRTGEGAPTPAADRQLFGHVSLSGSADVRQIRIALSITGASKLYGALEPRSSMWGLGAGFFWDKIKGHPRVEVHTPISGEFGQATTLLIGFGTRLGAR